MPHPSPIARRALAGALAATSLWAAPAAVSASGARFETGAGKTCRGTFDSSYADVPIDMECDGRPVYVTGTGRERATRWHDDQYRATRTLSRHDFPGDRLSLSPAGDGPSLVVEGHWTRHYTYDIPGDRSTRVLTETGAVYLATMPGEGVVFHDVGLIRFLPDQDFEGIADTHGPHDLYSDLDAVEQTVCDALT